MKAKGQQPMLPEPPRATSPPCEGRIPVSPSIENTLWCRRGFALGKCRLTLFIKDLAEACAFGGRFDAVYLDPGGGPDARFLRRDADRACPRRRPLRARKLATAFARHHRRLLRPAVLGSGGRGDRAVCRRRTLRGRSRPHGE